MQKAFKSLWGGERPQPQIPGLIQTSRLECGQVQVINAYGTKFPEGWTRSPPGTHVPSGLCWGPPTSSLACRDSAVTGCRAEYLPRPSEPTMVTATYQCWLHTPPMLNCRSSLIDSPERLRISQRPTASKRQLESVLFTRPEFSLMTSKDKARPTFPPESKWPASQL